MKWVRSSNTRVLKAFREAKHHLWSAASSPLSFPLSFLHGPDRDFWEMLGYQTTSLLCAWLAPPLRQDKVKTPIRVQSHLAHAWSLMWTSDGATQLAPSSKHTGMSLCESTSSPKLLSPSAWWPVAHSMQGSLHPFFLPQPAHNRLRHAPEKEVSSSAQNSSNRKSPQEWNPKVMQCPTSPIDSGHLWPLLLSYCLLALWSQGTSRHFLSVPRTLLLLGLFSGYCISLEHSFPKFW